MTPTHSTTDTLPPQHLGTAAGPLIPVNEFSQPHQPLARTATRPTQRASLSEIVNPSMRLCPKTRDGKE